MTAFLGMSPEQARTAGDSLVQRALGLTSALGSYRSIVTGVEWVGEDRDAFVAEWDRLAEAIDAFALALRGSGQKLMGEADQQTATSAA